jgi:transcriptional regulator with XRE-family HTH domain
MKILSDWLTKNKVTAAELARRIDASRSAVHRIVHGDRDPSLTMAQNIARVTGIPLAKLKPEVAKMFHGGR